MLRRPKPVATSSLQLYTLGAIFLLPLSIGVVLVSRNADQGDQAHKISHDLASLYAQGMDFSRTANQNIALSVTEGDGVDIRGGRYILILSKIRVVHAPDCASNAGKCSNQGYAVVTERYVLGNRSLRSSSFGTPDRIDPASGKVHDWANDPSARAENFVSGLKPGEVAYAAECFLTSPDSPGGVYSRTMF